MIKQNFLKKIQILRTQELSFTTCQLYEFHSLTNLRGECVRYANQKLSCRSELDTNSTLYDLCYLQTLMDDQKYSISIYTTLYIAGAQTRITTSYETLIHRYCSPRFKGNWSTRVKCSVKISYKNIRSQELMHLLNKIL